MTDVDFHCHSTASDGEHSPLELANRAVEAELGYWALTDHDTIEGYLSLLLHDLPLSLISGVELSVEHQGVPLHMVALNFDAQNLAFNDMLVGQMNNRLERAQVIADKLAKLGFVGVHEFVADLGQRPVSRPELANFLVSSGQVASTKKAFDKFLGRGKVGDVKQVWLEMSKAIDCVKAAGGVSILAHPETYKLNRAKLKTLVAEFKQMGGDGIELPHEAATGQTYKFVVKLAKEFELKVSVGSDFHTDKQPWRKLGKTPTIAPDLIPIWSQFSV